MKKIIFLLTFVFLLNVPCYCETDIYARSYDKQQWLSRSENSTEQSVFYEKTDGIDYIKITEFRKNTYDEFYNILNEIKTDKVIIDLRNNRGGYIVTAAKAAGLLLPEGKRVLVVNYRDGEQTTYYADGEFAGIKSVVLINVSTASAAEAFALALEQNGAVTVGEISYGKNSVQKLTATQYGGEKHTVGSFVVNGIDISSVGIRPDYKVLNDISIAYDSKNNEFVRTEIDNQLNKAKQLLGGSDYEHLS